MSHNWMINKVMSFEKICIICQVKYFTNQDKDIIYWSIGNSTEYTLVKENEIPTCNEILMKEIME